MTRTNAGYYIQEGFRGLRSHGFFTFAAIGIIAPCFNTAAAIIPLFFNRIAIAFRPLFAKRLGDAGGTDPLVVTREQNEENGETDDYSSAPVTSQNPEGGEK